MGLCQEEQSQMWPLASWLQTQLWLAQCGKPWQGRMAAWLLATLNYVLLNVGRADCCLLLLAWWLQTQLCIAQCGKGR